MPTKASGAPVRTEERGRSPTVATPAVRVRVKMTEVDGTKSLRVKLVSNSAPHPHKLLQHSDLAYVL